MEKKGPSGDTVSWLASLSDENDGVFLYEGLASLEKDPERAKVFRSLAAGEKRHASIWARKLEQAGVPAPAARPSSRTRLLLFLGRLFGTRAVLPIVLRAESADAAKYDAVGGEATALAADEREHGEALRRMGGPPAERGRGRILRRERWHQGSHGGAIRAAVFGMNDGLVSNLSLVLGVAAAGSGHAALVVAGLAGLFAGAFSMAVGEYVSVASQRDLLRRQIEMEARELREAPAEEEAELAELYRQKGLSAEQASAAARSIMANPESALDTLVREELGLDPSELGSPYAAAFSSFGTFAFGASLPLLPLPFLGGTSAAVASAALGALVLGGVGAILGVLSGTSATRSALRMVGLAAVAAGITVGIGRIVGVAVG
jgi:vacuolar iron transporter family protein